MKTTTMRILFWSTTAVLGFGCAHQGPAPLELEEARAIYTRAASGPAARHAPARLKLARQALEEAEMAYGAAPSSEVQDRAYIAIRRAEAAEAEASTITAGERRMAALRELATMTGAHADRARAELASANQKASEAGQRADLAQAQVAAEQTRSQSAEQLALANERRAQTSETQLESERRARADAELKAQKAMDELTRMANVRKEARGVVITLSGQVLFVTDRAELLPAAQSSLDGVAAALKQVDPNAGRVVIEGHSDATGQRDYNLDLSRRRAEAVRRYLVDKGVRAELFSVQGVGPDRPVANNRTAEGRANNRRVEIVIPQAAMAKVTLPTDSGSLARDKISPTPASEPAPGALTPASTTVPSTSPGTTAGPSGLTPSPVGTADPGTAQARSPGQPPAGSTAPTRPSTVSAPPGATIPLPPSTATPPSVPATPPTAAPATAPR